MPEQRIQNNTQGVGVWEHFTVKDGLPDMKIESLFVDSSGYLWVGTHDRGVARFDGDRFETFTRRDGLAGDGVFSILEDREGALWFGTNGGLTCYCDGKFEPVVPRSGERYKFLWGSCVDREGALWFTPEGRPGSLPAVCRWDGKNLDLLPMADTVGPPRSQYISQVVPDASGGIWFGGDGSLYYYDGKTFHCIPGLSGVSIIFALLPWPDGSLWIGSGTGLYLYADGRLKRLEEELIGDHWVSSILKDPSGTVWIITTYGKLIQYENGVFRLIQELDNRFWGNSCLDKSGRFWVGSYGTGLYCYDTTRFTVFHEQEPATNATFCLTEDATGLLWVGTQAGLAKYDGNTFQLSEEPKELKSWKVSSLLRDRQDRLLIGTWAILYRYDGKVLQSLPTSSEPYLENQNLASLAEDRAGRIWFGFQHGYGFGYYENGGYRRFLSDRDVVYPNLVKGLLVDRQGVVWIGSYDPAQWEGLCRYDGEAFTAITPADGLAGGAVLALYEDRESNLWIGTSTGVCRYDGRNFTNYNQTDGLPHEIVTAITQTEDGTFWFGTEGGGVCHYDGQVFQVITVPGDPRFNVIYAICQDSKGQIWLGTDSGLVRYTSKRVGPEVTVTNVIADRTYEATQEIEIPITAGRISFCFRGRSTTERVSHLVYRYRLEGYDQEWHQTKEQQVDYPQLMPGKYCFTVQAVDRDLNYSDMAEVRLTVFPDLRIAGLTEALRAGGVPGDFVGESSAIQRILGQIKEVASTDLTVLILGETGTGKGLVARSIHGLSARQEGPFITVNCGGITEGLVESEMFGHEKGSFTGAVSRKLGRVELAEGGTLFLDEIGDLAMTTQVKLLRFLEDREFERVGGEKTLRGDVRIIAATNRDLKKMVSEGQFREDLYYRLQEFSISVPPLRKRRKDIPMLASYFMARMAGHLNKRVVGLTSEALGALQAYNWPGNVRELEHVIQRAVVVCRGSEIRADEIELEFSGTEGEVTEEIVSLEEYERRYILRVLERTGWRVKGAHGAAELLGMHEATLRSLMKRLGISRGNVRP